MSLPPLPYIANFGNVDPADSIGRPMQSYAKLAVREALTQAGGALLAKSKELYQEPIHGVSYGSSATLADYLAVLDAIIKEYE